jgi:hypothetical protein
MGGRGTKSGRTDSLVRASLRVAHRKIRVRNPRGDAERFSARSRWTDRRENPLGSLPNVRTKTDTGG